MGIIQRAGIGKVRHIRTQALWLQELGREKRTPYHKILGDSDPAGAMTKHLAEAKLDEHLLKMNTGFEDGRAAAAPALCAMGWMDDLEMEHDMAARDGATY